MQGQYYGVDRNIAVQKRADKKEDDNFVPGSAEERISLMWELTAELWSLRGFEYVEGRLRRDVVKLFRPSDTDTLNGNRET